MKWFDFVIVGAGASGLSLACRLAAGPLHNCSILLVDRALRERADRTWAFWASKPLPFDSEVSHSWSRLVVATPGRVLTLKTAPFSYKVIRGADFYRSAHARLSRAPGVELVEGRVDRIEDGAGHAAVQVGTQEYAGRWVFDSRFRLAGFRPTARYQYLKMQFRGWEIETPGGCFDPQTATFLDFRTPQPGEGSAGGPRFLYVLPFDKQRALVEHVACVPAAGRLLHTDEQEGALREYIGDTLRIKSYQILGQEQGVNPMTNYPFPRRLGNHIMSIGIPAGMLKPTTGFAFTRIQRDSAAIVRSLVRDGHPFNVPASGWGYRLYESLMLEMMARCGGQVGQLLGAFFRMGSTAHILRFLDERGLPV